MTSVQHHKGRARRWIAAALGLSALAAPAASMAANAGDQVSLQCNAEGCDADGCAPRYKGVTHKRYISTKYGSDPMDPTGGVTDYRTAIVATIGTCGGARLASACTGSEIA